LISLPFAQSIPDNFSEAGEALIKLRQGYCEFHNDEAGYFDAGCRFSACSEPALFRS